MKQVVFKPTWDAFTLPDVVESIGVNVPTRLAIRATVMLDPGETSVVIDADDAPFITKVTKDGEIEVGYTLVDGVLSFPATPDDVSLLQIERSGEVTYSIFVGNIVPGIKVSSAGRLRGRVGNIPHKEPHVYKFGLRATWGSKVADVVKEWLASPADSQLTWNLETLPVAGADATKVAGRPFYTIGEFRRGQKVEVGIDLFNPDFTDVEIEMRTFAELVPNAKHYGGVLPTGLTVSNNPYKITGFIPAEAASGDYFFEVFVDEPFGPTPIILHIKLLGDQFDDFSAVNRISWITEGNLGTIREGHPALFRVSARNTNGSTVTYRLAPGSRSLPIGMSLTTTGEIQGRAPHVEADDVITFSVKASSGPYVSTQAFSFKILKTFVDATHLTVSLPLSGPTRRSWQAYADQIAPNRRFRIADPNFGSAKPNILLIRGLRALPITALEYDSPFELIVGPFKVAKVIDNGTHVYDVIYREFFDPMHGAGGFVPGDTDVIESPVYYPQDPSIQISEGTVRNLRSDLVNKIGLASVPAKRRVLGSEGGELLDRWMTSEQEDGTTIGYISAGVIGFVQAGKGILVSRSMTYGDIPVGASVAFDRLLVQEQSTSYFYYLGWDRNEDDDIEYARPVSPFDFQIDGIPVTEDIAMHPLPALSWSPAENGVTYTLRFYNTDTLLRTETELTSTNFTYTVAMQAEDDNPGHLFVDLVAVRDDRESEPVRASIRLRAGWGYGWGFRYGGAG